MGKAMSFTKMVELQQHNLSLVLAQLDSDLKYLEVITHSRMLKSMFQTQHGPYIRLYQKELDLNGITIDIIPPKLKL